MASTEQRVSKMEREMMDMKATNTVVGSLARGFYQTKDFSGSGTIRVQFTPKNRTGRNCIISIMPVRGNTVPGFAIEPQDGSGKVVMRIAGGGSVTVTVISTMAGTITQI